MKTYPEIITGEHLAQQAHITTDEVLRDIADTEAEVQQLRQLREAEGTMADSPMLGDAARRLSAFRVEARVNQIAEREAFISYLRRLLVARGVEVAP